MPCPLSLSDANASAQYVGNGRWHTPSTPRIPARLRLLACRRSVHAAWGVRFRLLSNWDYSPATESFRRRCCAAWMVCIPRNVLRHGNWTKASCVSPESSLAIGPQTHTIEAAQCERRKRNARWVAHAKRRAMRPCDEAGPPNGHSTALFSLVYIALSSYQPRGKCQGRNLAAS